MSSRGGMGAKYRMWMQGSECPAGGAVACQASQGPFRVSVPRYLLVHTCWVTAGSTL